MEAGGPLTAGGSAAGGRAVALGTSVESFPTVGFTPLASGRVGVHDCTGTRTAVLIPASSHGQPAAAPPLHRVLLHRPLFYPSGTGIDSDGISSNAITVP